MSTFFCTDTHINAIVTWAANHGVSVRSVAVHTDPQMVTLLLYTANVLAVNHRYNLAEPIGAITYKPTGLHRPLEILKLSECLDYQCNGLPDWESSLAKDLLDAIRQKAITKLPGYDAAPWSI